MALRLSASVMLLTVSMFAAADEPQRFFYGNIGVGSDYAFRGVSQTLGDYAAQASVGADLSEGFYTYAWASNVDFVPASEPDDGASYEIDLGIGYSTDLNDRWAIDLALVHYLFPGTVDGVDYDFNELLATLTYAGKYSATVAYSDDMAGTGAPSLFYDIGASFDLVLDLTLALHYGRYDLNKAYGADYSYVETSLARQFGNTTIMLSYANASDSADLIFAERSTGSRFVLSLMLDW